MAIAILKSVVTREQFNADGVDPSSLDKKPRAKNSPQAAQPAEGDLKDGRFTRDFQRLGKDSRKAWEDAKFACADKVTRYNIKNQGEYQSKARRGIISMMLQKGEVGPGDWWISYLATNRRIKVRFEARSGVKGDGRVVSLWKDGEAVAANRMRGELRQGLTRMPGVTRAEMEKRVGMKADSWV